MSQCSSRRWAVWPQIGENGPKWVQNGRQVLRIDPRACHDHFVAFGTGPATQNPQKNRPNSRSTAPGGRYWYAAPALDHAGSKLEKAGTNQLREDPDLLGLSFGVAE